jgi:hypothetical protein
MFARDSGAQDRGDGGFTDKYGVLWQRNIFVRDRWRSVAAPTTTEAVARPEQAFVLTGIVEVEQNEAGGAVLMAFVEDARAGATSRVKVGDPVARGRITQITFDSVEYEGAGHSKHIAIGMNLEGGTQIARSGFGPSTTMPASASSGSSDTGVSGAASDIEARMRQRRSQEIGK